eukprot:954528-Amphidinium_carterae.1
MERPLGPEEPQPPFVLEEADFDKSWWPRSHSDRADGRTTVCGSLLCFRAIPAGSPFGVQLLQAWLDDLVANPY